MPAHLYDRIGAGYPALRQADPRINAHILDGLGDAELILNVGAGSGNYEPVDRPVVALEPSELMTRQRLPKAAPVVRGVVEQLPFPDLCFDASLATFTIHHWRDVRSGMMEMRRVSRRQVLLVHDRGLSDDYWITEYFPEILDVPSERHPSVTDLSSWLDVFRIEVVPIPADCTDGFCSAWWSRPEALLDPALRAGSSALSQLDPEVAGRDEERLRLDLASGAWDARHGQLRQLEEYDMGYRLLVCGE